MKRRDFLILANALIASGLTPRTARSGDRRPPLEPPALPSAALDASMPLSRIALGSCYVPQFEKADVWRTIAGHDPQLFLYMGDNVYQSEENGLPELHELRAAYAALAEDRPFAALRAKTHVMVTWDDHDYGMNNAGAEFPARLASEALFKRVWAVSETDPRAHRAGVYYRESAGPEGRRTQVIVLDTRYFRTPQTVLGEEQWRWLEQTLGEAADFRLLVSSFPVLMEAEDGESWRHWPKERERLFELIARTEARNLLIVSGDSHFGAYYRNDMAVSWPLHELTASSLNFPMPEKAWAAARRPDPARRGDPYFLANHGMVLVDWEARAVALNLHDANGSRVRSETFELPPSRQ